MTGKLNFLDSKIVVFPQLEWFRLVFSEDSTYDSRLETVKIYLKLKQLMIEIDDVDESSDEEGNRLNKSEFLKSHDDVIVWKLRQNPTKI